MRPTGADVLPSKEIRMNHLPKVTGSKDVIGFLKAQHEQIKWLFEKVVAARGEAREALFAQLKSLLSVHEAAEERIVHPEAKRAIKDGPMEVAARTNEEKEAKKALAALGQLDVASDEFETKIRDLQSAVLAHADSEEKEEFDKLASKLDAGKLKDMREALEAVEAGASAHHTS
jgi:hemerythrin superfamily protein